MKTQIAQKFVALLGSYMTPEQFAEMKRRNAVETDPNICHSHDFIDANDVMFDAVLAVTGKCVDIQDDADCALWNAAWREAMPSIR